MKNVYFFWDFLKRLNLSVISAFKDLMLWILDDGIIIINVKTEGKYAQLNIQYWQKLFVIVMIICDSFSTEFRHI